MPENSIIQDLLNRVNTGESVLQQAPVNPVVGGDLNFQPLNKYDEGLLRGMNQESVREGNQSIGKAFLNAGAQSLAEIGFGTLEGIGYLLDFEQHTNIVTGAEQDFGNWFSDAMRSAKDHIGEEAPVYGGEGFQPLNPKWWAKNLPSISSTLSLMIPAAGATRGLSMGAKLIGAGNNLSKGSKLAAKGITGAVVSRYMENTMEAAEKAESLIPQLIAQGMTEEEAAIEAGRQASNVWYANLANLVTDIPQYMLFFGKADDALKGIMKANRSKVSDIPKQMFLEGVEEGVQFGIQEESASDGVGSTLFNTAKNFSSYFEDEEFLNAITLGAIGGGVFQTAGIALDKSIHKKVNQLDSNEHVQRAFSKLREFGEAVKNNNIFQQENIVKKEIISNDSKKNLELAEHLEAENPELAQNIREIEAEREQLRVQYKDQETLQKEIIAQSLPNSPYKKLKENQIDLTTERVNTDLAINQIYKVQNKVEEKLTRQEAQLQEQVSKDNPEQVVTRNQLVNEAGKEAIKEADRQEAESIKDFLKDFNNKLPEEGIKTNEEIKNLPAYEQAKKTVKEELIPLEVEKQKLKDKKQQLKESPEEFIKAEEKKEIESKKERIQESDNVEEIKSFLKDFNSGVQKEAKDKLSDIVEEEFEKLEENKDIKTKEDAFKEYPKLKETKDLKVSPNKTVEDIVEEEVTGEPVDSKYPETISQGEIETPILKNPKVKEYIPEEVIPEPITTNEKRQEVSEVVRTSRLNAMVGLTQDMFLKNNLPSHIMPLQAPIIKAYGIAQNKYTDIVRHLHKYVENPLTEPIYLTTSKNIEWNKTASEEKFQVHYSVKVDGKFIPIAMAPAMDTLRSKMMRQGVMVNGEITNPFYKQAYNSLLQIRKDLYKIKDSGDIVSLEQTVNITDYQKGRHNNNTEYTSLDELAGDTKVYLGTFKDKNTLLESVEESLESIGYTASKARNLSVKKLGFLYMLAQDTLGKYRWNRVFTKQLHEVPELVGRIHELLNKAHIAGMFIQENKIPIGKTVKSVDHIRELVYKDSLKEDPKWKNHNDFLDWVDNYAEYRNEIQSIIRFNTKDKNGKLKKEPDFGKNLFLIPKFQDAGIFSVKKYTNSLNLIERDSSGRITKSKPLQVSATKLNRGKYNESILNRLTTNLNNINDHFVSPTFIFSNYSKTETKKLIVPKKKNRQIRFKQSANNNKINIPKFKKWAIDKLGIEPQVVDGLINIGGIQAFGATVDAALIVSNIAERGTGYHEAFHLVFNTLPDSVKKRYLNQVSVSPEQIKKAEGTLKKLKESYEGIVVTAEQLAKEEVLADGFEKYEMGIESSFKRLYQRIKEFIKTILGKRTDIENLYRQISIGEFKNTIKRKTSPRFKQTDFTIEEESDLINILTHFLDVSISQDTNIKSENLVDGYKKAFDENIETNIITSIQNPDSVLHILLEEVQEASPELKDRIVKNIRTDLGVDSSGDVVQLDVKANFGALFYKLRDNLYTRGVQIKTVIKENNFETESLNIQDDSGGFASQISQRSISIKEGLTNRIKRYLANQPSGKVDSLGLELPLYINPNEAYAVVQTELGNSVDVADMIDKINNSKIEFIRNLPGITQESTLATELFIHIAQKIHPTFKVMTQDGKKWKMFDSNQSSKKYLILNNLYDKITQLNNEVGVKEKLTKYKTEPDKYQKEIKDTLHYFFPPPVVQAIGEDGASILESIVSGLNRQGEFNTRFNRLVQKLDKYYPQHYQSAHLNVEGEKVYEWSNSTFIGRQVNKLIKSPKETIEFYRTDPIYRNLPILQQIEDKEFTPELVITDGLKYNGKRTGVQYNNFSPRDSYITMLNFFVNNNNTTSAYIQLPVLGDSPINAAIKVQKLSKREAVDSIIKVIEAEFERTKNTPLEIKNAKTRGQEFVLFKEIVDSLDKFDKELVKEKVNRYIGKVWVQVEEELSRTGVKEEMDVKDFPSLLNQFIANHINYHSQLLLLTTGDPAFYKNTKDFYKRAKEIQSPGIYLNINAEYKGEGIPKTMKVKIVDDIETQSSQLSEINKVASRKFDKASLTDAQTFIDIRSYKYRLIGLGRWTDEHEKTFKQLDKGKLPKAVWQTLKPFFYNLEKNNEGRIIPFQKKDSEFIIIPFYGLETINGVENPTYNPEYKKILEDMGYTFNGEKISFNEDKRQYDVYTFDTSIKAGRPLDTDIVSVTFDSWRLQMETPEHHMDTEGLFGTQIMKLITSNFSNKELVEEYNKLIIEDIKRDYQNLLPKFKNINELREMLKDEVINRGLGEDHLNALNDNNFPLWHPVHYYRVSSILNSIFKKKITKRKFHSGFTMINTSAFGFKRQPKIVWNEGNPEKGIKHFEAYAPIHNDKLRRYLNKDGFIDERGMKEIEKYHPHLLEGIAYRIPTEDKYSTIPIKIIGFLPIDNGNIILPHDITAIAGLDFDIDKMFGFFFSDNPYQELLEEYERKLPKTIEGVDAIFKSLLTPEELETLENSSPQDLFTLGKHSKTYGEIKRLAKEEQVRIDSDNRKLEIMRTILQSEEVVSQILFTQGFDKIKETNQKIIEKQKIEISDDLLNPSTLVEVTNNMNTGKAILGIYANGNAMHSIMQNGELTIKKPVLFEGKQFDKFGQFENIEGESISRNLGMRNGMAVDNGKDPQAFYYNANVYTADVEVLLLQLGVPSDTVQYFLAQPSIKKFTQDYFNRGATQQAEKDLIELYKIQLTKDHEPSNHTKASLEKGLDKENKDMITDFLYYKNIARKVMSFQRAVKKADEGAGVTTADNYIKARLYTSATKQGQYESIIDGATDFLNSDQFMNIFHKYGIVEADKVIVESADLIKLGHNFNSLVNRLEAAKGGDLTAKEVTNLVNGYINYVISSVYPLDTNEIKETIKQLRAFKSKNPEHPLTSRLQIVKGDFIEFIGATGNDYNETNRIKESWNTLPESLVERLIKYSIWQSGMSQGYKGFSHLQPFSFHQKQLSLTKDKFKKAFEHLNVGQSEIVDSFFEQYVRNHFRQLSFVPSVQTKSITQNQLVQIEPINRKYPPFVKFKDLLFKHDGEGFYYRIGELGKKTGRITRFQEYKAAVKGLNSKFNPNYNKDIYNKLRSNISNSNVQYQVQDKLQRYIMEDKITKICD